MHIVLELLKRFLELPCLDHTLDDMQSQLASLQRRQAVLLADIREALVHLESLLVVADEFVTDSQDDPVPTKVGPKHKVLVSRSKRFLVFAQLGEKADGVSDQRHIIRVQFTSSAKCNSGPPKVLGRAAHDRFDMVNDVRVRVLAQGSRNGRFCFFSPWLRGGRRVVVGQRRVNNEGLDGERL